MTNGNFSFDDLGEVRTDALLIRPDGKQVHVPMRSLSDSEVWAIRKTLPQPVAPTVIGRHDGPDKPPRPGPVTSGPAYQKYQDELSDVSRLYNRKLMVRALCIDIPGANDDEKLAALETRMGSWALRQLTDHLNRMLGIGDLEVSAAAETFQQPPDSDTPDTEGAGLDAEPVAETVAHG